MTEIATATAYEDLAAGSFVHVFEHNGVAHVRRASAMAGRPADAFVLDAVKATAAAPLHVSGLNPHCEGLRPGANAFLALDKDGAASSSIPQSDGVIVQFLGKALSASHLLVRISDGVQLSG